MTTSTSYTHLSTHERSIIQIRIKDRHSLRDIASEIGRSPSTVSREVRRNCTSRGYLSYDADLRAAPRHHRRRAWLDKHEDVARALVDVLQDKRSPAQALSILLERGVPYLPSVESIYQWIYSSSVPTAWDARSCLRRGRHYRKPRTGLASGVGKIRDTTHISARSFAPEDRSEFGRLAVGSWEGDLVLGTRGTSALITLVERQSRYSCVVAVPLRTAATITTALTTLVGTLGTDNVKSITWDNGKDLSDHAVLTKYTGVPVYFCDTHSPWQRGTNENTNGVLRWQYPKGATLDLDPAKAAAAAAWLNTRPMPVLSNRTPNDVFAEQSVALQC